MKSAKKIAGIVLMVIGISFSIISFLSALLSLIELQNDVAEQYVFLEGHEPFYLGYILGLSLPILIGMVVAVIGFFLYRSSRRQVMNEEHVKRLNVEGEIFNPAELAAKTRGSLKGIYGQTKKEIDDYLRAERCSWSEESREMKRLTKTERNKEHS